MSEGDSMTFLEGCAVSAFMNFLVAFIVCFYKHYWWYVYEYQYQSPQEIKYALGSELHRELIFSNLLETLQSSENPLTLEDFINDNEFKDLVS